MILYDQETIDDFTRAGFWHDKTLIDYLKKNARQRPDREALIDPLNKQKLVGQKPLRLTWSEIDTMVDRVALGFIEIGLKPDDFAIMQLPNVTELIITHFALTRIGVIVVPAKVQLRSHEIGQLIGLTEAKAIIVPGQFHGFDYILMAENLRLNHPQLRHVISLGDNLPQDITSLSNLIQRPIEEEYPNNHLDQFKPTANDVITLISATGAEAEIKGVPRSHNNCFFLVPIAASMSALFNIVPSEETILGAFPMTTMAGLGAMCYPWVGLGGKMVLHHPFDPEVFLTQIEQETVTFAGGPPAVHHMLLNHPTIDQRNLQSVKYVASGAAPLTQDVVKGWKDRFNIEVVNIYGSTEGMGMVGMDADEEKRTSYFPTEMASLFGFRVKVVDEQENELIQPGDTGELVGKGPFLFPCYYKRPDLTRQAFTDDGFFKSGDLFTIEEDGKLKSAGRSKEIIIRGGANISPKEIENVLDDHPKVLESAAVEMPDERLGEKVCVYISPKEGETITLAELISHMRKKHIAEYKLPERMEIMRRLPKTLAGKIHKELLKRDILIKLELEREIRL